MINRNFYMIYMFPWPFLVFGFFLLFINIMMLLFCRDYDKIILLARVRKIYKEFPRIPVPQQLGDLDDVQQLSETLGAAKTCVEGCSSFLKAALK